MRHADREARPARPRRLTRRRLLAGLGAGLLAVPAAGAAGLVTVRERGPSVASILPPAAGSPATPACPALPPAAPQAAAAAPGDAGVRLVVPDGPVLVDAPLVLRVEGLAPRQAVTLRAQLGDSFNQHWEAWATFRADGRGVVDVAAQAPEDGTYTDADPLGLVWSARPTGDPARAIAYFDLTLAPQPLRLAAEVEGAAAATATVERRTVAPGGVAREVYEASLFGRLYHPAGGDPAPAVLVLGGSEGGLTTVSTRPAALLAARGYAALALAYCGVGTLPPRLERVPLEYFAGAVAWLGRQPEARGDRLAVLGTSRGGELALLLGALDPRFLAAISYVGSGTASAARSGTDRPSWTYRGAALPGWGDPRVGERRAAIPVERTNGPVLLLSGEDDRIWDSAPRSQIAAGRLRRAKRPYADEHVRYPGAGHLLRPPALPTTVNRAPIPGVSRDAVPWGGEPRAQAAADADAWRRTLALLDGRLRC